MSDMLNFDLPKNQSSIIKVLGVGGGGSNAVTHMYKQGISGVDFIVCNTDAQALESSPIPTKIQLGSKGLGAGSIPEIGKIAANENIEDLKKLLENNTKMLFITAGMGGGTGTGAAPVIATVAKELGILTVGIVTIPFSFEGRKRRLQAEQGIEDLKKNVDSLLIICNDKLRELHGNLKLSDAFSKADNILSTAAKGIAEIITVAGYINVDFEDVKTVMQNSGVAIMGSGVAEGENRSIEAVDMALSSPLLNDNSIKGSDNILLYLASGNEEISMDEVTEITDYIQNEAGKKAEIIWGNGFDESLENNISVTIIATNFGSGDNLAYIPTNQQTKKKIIIPLESAETKQIRKEEKEVSTTKSILDIKLKNDKSPDIEVEVFTTPEDGKNETAAEKNKPSLITKQDQKALESIENKSEPTIKKQEEYNSSEIKEHKITEKYIALKSEERIKKLRELSIKLKTSEGLAEVENEPAYIRRKVELTQVKPSSESEISRYTLAEGDDKTTEIKSNNSFLHDNVD